MSEAHDAKQSTQSMQCAAVLSFHALSSREHLLTSAKRLSGFDDTELNLELKNPLIVSGTFVVTTQAKARSLD